MTHQVHDAVSPTLASCDSKEMVAEHVRQNQGSPVWGVGSGAKVLKCTTMALLLFFFTFTIFSSLGFTGAEDWAAAVGMATADDDADEDEEDEEDFLKKFLNRPPLLDRP